MLKDKTIFDRNKMPTIKFDRDASVEKTSDNLLDLLEVGDCVELCNKNGETFIYHMADKEAYNNAMVDINDLTEEDNAYVKAIWKRNGDIMRRYEI